MTEAALTTTSLSRRYRRTWALRDCTLEVPAGSITGLVGPNGAGKSTLLRLAAGLSTPTSGTVSLFGTPVRANRTEHLSLVGYLDQLRPLYLGLKVSELLTLGRKVNSSWDDEYAHEWLAELDIPLGARAGKLSIGQQVLVALALCLAKRPALLLLDEPTASLDPLARQRLFRALLSHVADGQTTVLLSSHVLSELEPVCDHLVLLSNARVRLATSVEELVAGHRVVIGPPLSPTPPGIDVIGGQVAARQTPVLVRGRPGDLGPQWQVAEPSLDEIVLAYLTEGDRVAGPPSELERSAS
ncbi:MAG TPA: ABC transporter ATP-binding protein [Acidimicrobiales bacterium]|nr:ABC transporter ATP-binding protein [Acidimicrobiales bacterium]